MLFKSAYLRVSVAGMKTSENPSQTGVHLGCHIIRQLYMRCQERPIKM